MTQSHLYNSTFESLLPQLESGSIDLILTDPPYAISRETGFKHLGDKSVERFAVSMDFGEWDARPIELDFLCQQAFRLLRKGGTCIIFYDLWKIETLRRELELAGFKQIRLIEWLKTNPVPLNSSRCYLSNAREVAVVAVKGGNGTFNSTYDKGVYEFPIPRKNRWHPTPKPEELFSALIEKHSNVGDIVLDCFVGSGTTLNVGMQLDRNVIAIESDPCYYKRIQQTQLENKHVAVYLNTESHTVIETNL